MPFFTDDSRRAGSVGDQPSCDRLKTCDSLGGVQRADADSDGDSDYERCDEQPLHRQSSFLCDRSRIIGFHYDFAQEFIRSVNCLGSKNKLGSACVLFDQIQAELVIFE